MLELCDKVSTHRDPLAPGVEPRIWFICADKAYERMWLRRYGITNPDHIHILLDK